jgi:hypothetical protein
LVLLFTGLMRSHKTTAHKRSKPMCEFLGSR